jgi:hypothetical protein
MTTSRKHNTPMPTIQETLDSASKSAAEIAEHARQALSPEDLMLFALYYDHITTIAMELASASKHKVWKEILAGLNKMEDNAHKFFGEDFIKEASK